MIFIKFIFSRIKLTHNEAHKDLIPKLVLCKLSFNGRVKMFRIPNVEPSEDNNWRPMHYIIITGEMSCYVCVARLWTFTSRRVYLILILLYPVRLLAIVNGNRFDIVLQ